MTTAALPIEQFVQYTHLEKLYGHLPGLRAALPGIFGLDNHAYEAMRQGFDRQARAAAHALLADPETAAQVDALPFEPGARVLAVGDSITDDLASWAEILRHLLAIVRPDDAITVVNAGLSAHTSAMVLRRWPAMLAEGADWVLCGLGDNDVTRIDGGKPQITTGESVANLSELRRIAGAAVRWIWLTPVPVDEERLERYPPFRFGRSSWRNADIVALADRMADFADPVVDLVASFGVPPRPELQGPDGVHPTLAGQQAIAAALLRSPGSP